MHKNFFGGLNELLSCVFDTDDYSSQPAYMVDMGCGDGRLLCDAFKFIRAHTKRGKHLAEFPLLLVGVDFNNAALEATSRTLSDSKLPFRVFHGDIGDPGAMMQDLEANGIARDQILHVRSFLDHDRPYIPGTMSVPPSETSLDAGVFVHADGSLISHASMMQSLTEHLERWASVLGPHGLMVMEVHCQDTSIVSQHLGEMVSLWFDGCQALSKQHLVRSQDWFMCAGQAGLLPKLGSLQVHPKNADYTRVTVTHFKAMDGRIRNATLADIPRIMELHKKRKFSSGLTVDAKWVSDLMEEFPEGQFVLTVGGVVTTVMHTQRIRHIDALDSACIGTERTLHSATGPVVQILRMASNGAVWGRTMRDFVLALAHGTPGVRKVVAVSSTSNYRKGNGLTFHQYISQIPQDLVLNFHRRAGAELLKPLPRWNDADLANEGHGVLVQYDLSRNAGTCRRAHTHRSCASSCSACVLDT